MGKWEMVRLGDVCDIVSGTTPSTNKLELWDGDVRWIAPAEISDDSYFIYDTVKHISQKAGLKPMPIGTVLLSSRAPIGKVAIAGSEMCCNQGFKNFICSEKVHNRYLYRYLKNKTEYLNSLGRGATFKEISKSIVEQIEIPLPPLLVQQKIADILDRASTLIEQRKAQVEKLDMLVKSQFIEMFGDPVTNPKEWPNEALGVLGEFKNGINFRSTDRGYRCICLGVGDFKNHYQVDGTSGLSAIHLSEALANDYLLQNGDIVFVRSNGNPELVGRNLIVYPGKEEVTFSGFCIRFRKSNRQTHEVYLNHLLRIPSLKSRLLLDGRGCNIKNLNQQMLASQSIILPPLSMQKAFCTFVAKIEAQEIILRHSLSQLELNYKSLVQKCFGGEIY